MSVNVESGELGGRESLLFSFSNLLEFPLAFGSFEMKQEHVVLEETRSVRNSDESCLIPTSQLHFPASRDHSTRTDTEIFGVLIHRAFNIGRNSRSAFVQNGEFWEVVEETSHSHLCRVYFSMTIRLCLR